MRKLPTTILLLSFCGAQIAATASASAPQSAAAPLISVWGWVVLLFLFCFAIGILAVLAGVGGGVLFVPLVGALFPFHMDFVRGASLFVALAGALSASGRFLVQGLTFPRLALPLGLASSLGAIAGAMAGLAVPEHLLRLLLGQLMIAICMVMAFSKRAEHSRTAPSDRLAAILKIKGQHYEPTSGVNVVWFPQRMPLGIVLFAFIGFIAGLFGLGAGWASVPALNLVMGAPLKSAVATSLFVISISNTPASMVYLNAGAVLPIITVPSVLGMILGSQIGTRIMGKTSPRVVRLLVLILLAVSGVISMLKGLGVM